MGWQGVRRRKKVRTTVADPAAGRAPDLVDRQFAVSAPNRLLVADFTYLRLSTGAFAYVAFVIDAYAGAITGWQASASKQTRFVESAIRQACALRVRQGLLITGAIHHSDAGSQYTAVHYGETLSLSGLRPSIGSVGDAYDAGGHLVQPAAPHAPPRPCPTRRNRSPLLCPRRDRPTGRLTETRRCMRPGTLQESFSSRHRTAHQAQFRNRL